MKKYKCTECGTIFTSEDAGTVSERVGEFWGAPAYNDFVACPRCLCTELDPYDDDDDDDN